MAVSGSHLSLFGRSALASIGVSRTSSSPALDPVSATEPLKDAITSEYRELQQLEQRERGAAGLSDAQGPGGTERATGGKVATDPSVVGGDPEATIRQMQVLQHGAPASAEPDAQDRAVEATRGGDRGRAVDLEQRADGTAAVAPSRTSRQALGAYRDTAATLGPTNDRAAALDLIA